MGCDEDPIMYTENDYLSLIYCIYCPEDSIIEVRVGRSFQGHQSAYQTAKIPDTAFLSSLELSLELVSEDNKLLLGRRDIPLELLPNRQNGMFYTKPNYCFVSKTLFPLSSYWSGQMGTLRLQLFDPGLKRYSVGESYFIPKPEIFAPRNELGKFQASFYSTDRFEVRFNNIGYPYELKIAFFYKERITGQAMTVDTISWHIEIPFMANSGLSKDQPKYDIFPLFGDDFFREISRRIPIKSLVVRQFESFAIELYATDPIIREYEVLYEAISDIDPGMISNIANGLGLFACIRRAEVTELRLDPRSLDSLCEGRFTRNLNFKKW